MRINGFEQIKAFYSWSFENQELGIKSQHISLYMFLVNQNNRNSWVEWFKLPMDLGMAGSCISSKKTYYACLADLQSWGLIEYQKGINDWKAPLIKLEVLKDTATIPQSEPQVLPLLAPQVPTLDTPQLLLQLATQPIPNIKLLTNNFKLVTENIKEVLIFLNRSEEYTKESIDIELLNCVMKFFGFNEITNPDKMRDIRSFLICLGASNRIDYFKVQFSSYSKLKNENPKFKHAFPNYLGTPSKLYEDGAWNSENWSSKLTEEPKKVLGYTPQVPN